jgi:multicomponent Na+:H+ antiporter subunit D
MQFAISNWIYIPILLPLGVALFCIVTGKSSILQRVVVMLSNAFLILTSFILLFLSLKHEWLGVTMGGWDTIYGITLAVDPLSAIMLILGSITGFFCILYQYFMERCSDEHPLKIPLIFFLITGINLSFITSDLFNLYVAFELMLLSSFGLMTLEQKKGNIKIALPYVLINVLGSLFFLICCSIIYAYLGTLNFANLSLHMQNAENPIFMQSIAMILTLVMGIKAGIFPLYYWLPNSYPILPIPVLAFYSGMLTKVGVYVLLRLTASIFPPEFTWIHESLLWIAGLTMIFGVLGAISRNYTRGILSYHIISQIGFMVLAIGIFTISESDELPAYYPLTACIFYVIHHILVKSSLFLIGGTAALINGTDDLKKTGNIWISIPILGILFLFQSLSLAGIPPLSGFWGKYMIMVAGIANGEYVIIGISMLASVLTLFSMLKIWNGVFWKQEDYVQVKEVHNCKGLIVSCGGMVLLSILVGLNAETIYNISSQAAEIASDQASFREAFLGHSILQ